MLKLARYVTLRQLQVFETIARFSSVTRAAEALHLTQPTVSTQLRTLSDAVGVPLIEQVGKKIFLTEAGKVLHRAAREMLETLDRAEMQIADLQGMKTGSLRLGIISTAKYFAPGVLGKFAKRFPDIDVAITVGNRESILKRLQNNEDDLYIIGHNPQKELSIEAITFAPNPLFVVAAKHHPLAKQQNIELSQIAGLPFIAREPGSGIRAATEQLLMRHGLKANVRMELSSNEAIKHAVMGDLGISVLSLHSILSEVDHGQLAVLDVEGFPLQRQWNLVYPRGKELSVVAREFIEFITEEGKQLADVLAAASAKLPVRESTAGAPKRPKRRIAK
jgi:DNA-binding transcriptional LysR family regulator